MAVEFRKLDDFSLTPDGLLDSDGNHWFSPGKIAREFDVAPGSIRKAIRVGTLPAIGIQMHDQTRYYVCYPVALRWKLTKPHHKRGRTRTRKRQNREPKPD